MRPDDSAPETGGCGGMFPWSKLTPVAANALVGDYTVMSDGVHAITQNAWAETYGDATSHFVFTQVLAGMNDTSGRLVARNADSNAFSPGLWSAFDWVQMDGAFWYCQSKYDGATVAEAVNAEAADATDVATAGCGGMFPWTRLIAQ